MVVTALGKTVQAAIYVLAMVALFLHLSHGIQSTFQTLGVSNAFLLPRYGVAGKVLSGFFLIGYGAIPVLIVVGLLAI
jgi:succinate dehydrogenase / fumarate reductase cytochrome b subunit